MIEKRSKHTCWYVVYFRFALVDFLFSLTRALSSWESFLLSYLISFSFLSFYSPCRERSTAGAGGWCCCPCCGTRPAARGPTPNDRCRSLGSMRMLDYCRCSGLLFSTCDRADSDVSWFEVCEETTSLSRKSFFCPAPTAPFLSSHLDARIDRWLVLRPSFAGFGCTRHPEILRLA